MPQVRELLIDGLQDLYHAEGQLIEALPKMVKASKHPTVKLAFEKHLSQTKMQVERLQQIFELLGEPANGKPCKAMMGLIKEGDETIQKAGEWDPIPSDLSLIAAAQKIEHYEIASYGTARALARQTGEVEIARLLTQTLGEEEGADFILTAVSEPLLQQAVLDDMGAEVNLETVGVGNGKKRSSGRSGKA